MAMMNSNLNSASSFNSSSSVVSSNGSSVSSAVNSSSATSNSVNSSENAKVTPTILKPLKERTSADDVSNKVRNLKITDNKGNKITAALMAPSYKDAMSIDDSRQAFNMVTREMTLTTVRFYSRLFKIIRNLEVNEKPVGRMTWHFADEHTEAFNWIMDQANSFLADKFRTN